MAAHTNAALSDLLPTSPHILAYALPLLLLSLLLTFAGAFLTLDRTRAFAPRYDALQPPETNKFQHTEAIVKRIFRLGGGIGGIAVGYVTGVHFATFVALLVPNVSSNAPLSAGAFVAVWLLTSIVCAILAARWKYVALGFAGLVGYSTLALAVSIIVHPSLLTRVVLTGIFTPIGVVMSWLPIARTQHAFVRVGMASAGSFGTILSIATLAHNSSWSDPWGRLWIHDGNDWGTATEKGLSAAFCLFLLVGVVSDWFLKTKLGENPDEASKCTFNGRYRILTDQSQKWDSYLAEYAATLPNASDRAGSFKPLQSFWARHFGRGSMDPIDKDIIFPADADLKRLIPESPLKLHKKSLADPWSPQLSTQRFTPPQELLRKDRKPVLGRGRTRDIVKFDPRDPYVLSGSDSEDDFKKDVHAFVRSPTRTDSMATLTDDKPSPAHKQEKGRRVTMDPLSDYEEDVTSLARRQRETFPGEKWTPGFIRRYSKKQLHHQPSTAGFSQAASSSNGTASSNTLTPTAFTPVPATPSLIKAVERVNVAQQAAFSRQAVRTTDGLPMPSTSGDAQGQQPAHVRGPNWDAFWHEVRVKAGQGFYHRRDGGNASASPNMER
ncbi:hypothetical protein BN946_scf184654.g11 [Trametes cinnabarina]|uniref:DUF4203 domain-containing protein n=1 Tax=Pycnoporus cinnabarinus TaxID=5643 RepID=A0A060SSA7_PYCCI|nr:hypothetical protein BN946_scf184654.g11 [Trametes cinnabarina]